MAGNWTKLTVSGHVKDLDGIAAVMSMLDNGLMIEDYSDFSLNGMYGELVDDTILNADRDTVKVSLFVPEDKSFIEYKEYLETRIADLGIDASISFEGVSEDDWAESWKQYYKPIPLGRVTVVPAWEKYEAKEGEILVRMDPGMAFGTGTHETTRLVIELLEKYTKPGCRVLDVGTGSGILAISASLLGAGSCRAYDIDEVAVRVARDNVKENGCNNIVCDVSDLLKGVDRTEGPYDLVCANIVADIIIRMAPDVGEVMKDDAILLVSGIISERAQDVIDCFEKHGYKIVEKLEDNGWCGLAVMKK